MPPTPNGETPPSDQDPSEATLVFHEQADGRKVGRLPGGKVVLIDLKVVDRVSDGEAWFVRLRHKETFAIAEPVERVNRAALELAQPTLTSSFADALAKARPVEVPRSPAPATPKPLVVEPAAEFELPRLASPTQRAPRLPAPAASIDITRVVRPTDRVALFIDGANTDFASRAAGYFVDFRKAREYFLAGGTYYGSFYYVADYSDADQRQTRFFDFLSHAGYIVRRRPVKVIRDQDTGERIIKGNLDTEIVLDMLNTVGNYDVAFLFSGDSDFERAVDLLRSRGKRLYIVTSRGQLSRELAYVADKPIFYLEDHHDRLARDDAGR